MKKMTRSEAIAYSDQGRWSQLTPVQRAQLQLDNEFLCMPIAVFLHALQTALGRPVFTHEIATRWDEIRDELRERYPKSETASPPRPAVST